MAANNPSVHSTAPSGAQPGSADTGSADTGSDAPAAGEASIDAILARTRVIALVGASPNPSRASHRVGDFLAGRGYRVIPVNPGQAGRTLFGETARADLSALAAEGIRVDMVDIFRQSAHAGAVVDEAIAALGPLGLATIWMQLGVVDDDAAARARAAGLDVVMDRCPKIELERPG